VLTVAISSLILLVGTVAFLAVGFSRHHLSICWPGLIFPVFFSAFHFASLGTYAKGWYAPELVPMAWSLASVSLLAWMAGHTIARGKAQFTVNPTALLWGRKLGPADLRTLSRLGALMFAGGFALQCTLYFEIGLGEFLQMDYLQFKRTIATSSGSRLIYLHAIGELCCIVGMTVSACATSLGEGRLFHSRWVLALLLLDVLTLVLQGDRSAIVFLVLPLVLFRHYFIRRFRLREGVVLAVLSVMLISGTKIYRGTKNSDDFLKAAMDVSMLDTLANETGSTMDTMVRAMTLVPERQDYFWGMTYVHAAARSVPNVTLSQRKWGFVSSTWVTQETAPELWGRHGGLGFSIVAEGYINFGILGAPILLMFIGLLHGRLERWIAGATININLAILFVIIEMALLMHVRNSAVAYIRGSLWMGTLFVALMLTFRIVRKRVKDHNGGTR
jgi:hypothetical protein